MKTAARVAIVLALAVPAGAVAWYAWRASGASVDAEYRTMPVVRTDVVATIRATGTVVPEDVVDVGAQVNGQIAAFGTDADGKPVDYGSIVEKGAVLAKIDEALFAADVATARAELEQANAQVRVAEANLAQAAARLDQAARDWERAQTLSGSPALAAVDYDAARSAFEQAKASVAVAEASIVQAKAQVSSAQASVQRAERNLGYTTIKSPVDGVIIDRRVEIGQTVVASLNAPSLFLIANDMRRMKVLVQVNEADIGHVHAGDAVTFTTDANEGKAFRGTVRKVRLNATLTQNVVTYTVEILTDNADLALLPYLTANVVFETARRVDVLAVPNAALRWSPREELLAGAPDAPGEPEDARRASVPVVWALDGDRPRAIEVRTGASDGAVTEASGEGLVEGLALVVGERAASSGAQPASTNPFAPPMRRRSGGR